MNVLEVWVSNITSVTEPDEYGIVTIIADQDCWGNIEEQIEFSVTQQDYESIVTKGYYLA